MKKLNWGIPIVSAGAILWILPLFYAIRVSLDGSGISNYGAVLSQSGVGRALVNSTITSSLSVLFVVLFSSMAAFAISKLRFAVRGISYILILAGLMIPAATTLVPLFHMIAALDWLNTYQALIVPYTAFNIPFAVLLLKHAYDSIPNEYLEASLVDGASTWTAFIKVMAPLSIPTLVMVTIWTFLGTWNELLLALLFMQDKAMQTVPVIPIGFQLAFSVDQPKIFAALILIEIPVVVLYVLFQRWFERGLTTGGIK
jgi:raffinose/stachyose/melibiose transport system permease protein